jgi:hypothetical protein
MKNVEQKCGGQRRRQRWGWSERFKNRIMASSVKIFTHGSYNNSNISHMRVKLYFMNTGCLHTPGHRYVVCVKQQI